MHDPATIAARIHLRDLDRAAARAPRLVPYGTAAKRRRQVDIYSVSAIAICVISVVTLSVLTLSGVAA